MHIAFHGERGSDPIKGNKRTGALAPVFMLSNNEVINIIHY